MMTGKSGIKEEMKCKREEECKVLRGVGKEGEREGENEGEKGERVKEREGQREERVREEEIWGRGRERWAEVEREKK